MRLLTSLAIGIAIICIQVYLGMKTFFPEAQLNNEIDVLEEIIQDKNPILDKISQNDLAWLSKNPQVRIGTDPNFYPIETFDERGIYTGLASDYLKIISHLTGLDATAIQDKDWASAEQAAQAGEIDMFMAIVQSPRRDEYLNFTNSYINLPGMIMTHRDHFEDNVTIESFNNKKVIVVEDYYWHDYLERNHPEIELILASNTLEALQALVSKEADALVDFEFNLLEKVQVGGFYQLENAGIIESTSGHALAVREELSELYNIVNIALASISLEERELLAEKWLARKEK